MNEENWIETWRNPENHSCWTCQHAGTHEEDPGWAGGCCCNPATPEQIHCPDWEIRIEI